MAAEWSGQGRAGGGEACRAPSQGRQIAVIYCSRTFIITPARLTAIQSQRAVSWLTLYGARPARPNRPPQVNRPFSVQRRRRPPPALSSTTPTPKTQLPKHGDLFRPSSTRTPANPSSVLPLGELRGAQRLARPLLKPRLGSSPPAQPTRFNPVAPPRNTLKPHHSPPSLPFPICSQNPQHPKHLADPLPGPNPLHPTRQAQVGPRPCFPPLRLTTPSPAPSGPLLRLAATRSCPLSSTGHRAHNTLSSASLSSSNKIWSPRHLQSSLTAPRSRHSASTALASDLPHSTGRKFDPI